MLGLPEKSKSPGGTRTAAQNLLSGEPTAQPFLAAFHITNP
jgi:hypothetical protein